MLKDLHQLQADTTSNGDKISNGRMQEAGHQKGVDFVRNELEIAETILAKRDELGSLPALLRPWNELIDEDTGQELKSRRSELIYLVTKIVEALAKAESIDSVSLVGEQNVKIWNTFCDNWRKIASAAEKGDLELGDRLLYYPRILTAEEPFTSKIRELRLTEKMGTAVNKMGKYTEKLSRATETAFIKQQKDISAIAERLKPILEKVNSLDDNSQVSFTLRHFYNDGNLRFALRQYNRNIVGAGHTMKGTISSEEEIVRMANAKEEPKPERGIATAHELSLIVEEIVKTASEAKNTYSKVLPANEPPATPTDVVQETRNGGVKKAMRKLLSLSV